MHLIYIKCLTNIYKLPLRQYILQRGRIIIAVSIFKIISKKREKREEGREKGSSRQLLLFLVIDYIILRSFSLERILNQKERQVSRDVREIGDNLAARVYNKVLFIANSISITTHLLSIWYLLIAYNKQTARI